VIRLEVTLLERGTQCFELKIIEVVLTVCHPESLGHNGQLHTHLKFKSYSVGEKLQNKLKCNWRLVKVTRFETENTLTG